MAKTPPSSDGHRHGAVSQRSQFQLPSGLYAKRDTQTGRTVDAKTTGGPFYDVWPGGHEGPRH